MTLQLFEYSKKPEAFVTWWPRFRETLLQTIEVQRRVQRRLGTRQGGRGIGYFVIFCGYCPPLGKA